MVVIFEVFIDRCIGILVLMSVIRLGINKVVKNSTIAQFISRNVLIFVEKNATIKMY